MGIAQDVLCECGRIWSAEAGWHFARNESLRRPEQTYNPTVQRVGREYIRIALRRVTSKPVTSELFVHESTIVFLLANYWLLSCSAVDVVFDFSDALVGAAYKERASACAVPRLVARTVTFVAPLRSASLERGATPVFVCVAAALL